MLLGIIADDLTGACDTALGLHGAGHQALVALRGAALLPDAAAVALDADSRDLPLDEAYARTRRGAELLLAAGAPLLYKKVDSTLRGAVGRELDALLAATAAEAVVLAPAFPAAGRLVRAGRLLVAGTPLDATPFATGLPLRSAVVAEVVAATAHSTVAGLAISPALAGPAALRAALQQGIDLGARILIVDATTDADLATLAAVLVGRPHWLAAGSAGLAEQLAALLPRSQPAAPSAQIRAAGPVLALVGSRHPVARAGLAALGARMLVLELDGRALLGPTGEHEVAMAAATLGQWLAAGRHAALTLAPPSAERPDDPSAARDVATRLAQVVATLPVRLGGLIATGGSTAAAALAALGTTSLAVLGGVEPGVPLLQASDGPKGLLVVTKAGGFGNSLTLVRALDCMVS